MRANLALPVILPWPRAISTGNWNWPQSSLVCQSQSICTSCRMPNWSGPIPEPVTSVRLPHSAPAPNASCISVVLLDEGFEAPLQLFLGGESVVPGGGGLSHRRAGEMVFPPALNERITRVGPASVLGRRRRVVLGERRRVRRKRRICRLGQGGVVHVGSNDELRLARPAHQRDQLWIARPKGWSK